jgi:ParB family chromosome partitioning protein
MKRKALGKGLRSLIPQAPAQRPGSAPTRAPATAATPPAEPGARSSRGLLQLDLDRIRPNTDQPRRAFDQVSLEELAASMKHEGVLQPIIVRPLGEGEYELIAGERRWRAAQIAGLLKIPALVRDVADDRVLEMTLIENLQREDLNPIEAAAGFQALIDDLGLTQQEVAARVGKQRATVANMLRLLDLPGPVKQKLRDGSVSTGHAKVLASLETPQLQVRLADRIARDGLSVRETERLVKRMTGPASPSAQRGAAERDPNVVAAEEALQKALGTKVSIAQGKKGGRIELHFYSDDELERVYQIVLKAAQSSQKTGAQT